MFNQLKPWLEVTAGEVLAAVIAVVGAVGAGVAFVVTWAIRIDGRVSSLEQDRSTNCDDHKRIESKLDRLIDHLISSRE